MQHSMATIATILTRRRVSLSIFVGEVAVALSKVPIRPSSVLSPVRVTRMIPLPLTILDPA